jgi:uncharacterized protein YcgL (UPF0745 family)
MIERLVEVFKGSRKPGAYLYVDQKSGLSDVPKALLAQLGETESVLTLLLNERRKLARADPLVVLTQIQEQGYYLQMPPSEAELAAGEAEGG